MTPYYVRVAGTNKIQGVFWARTLAELWVAVDEMADPVSLEYAKPRRPGGLWHDLPFSDTKDSTPGTPGQDFCDGHLIHPIGSNGGEYTIAELIGDEPLTWHRFASFPDPQ